MKNILLITLALLFLNCSNNQSEEHKPKVLNQLNELANEHNYFKLKSIFDTNKNELCKNHRLYFKAKVENVFFNPKESNLAIAQYIENNPNAKKDSIFKELYLIKKINHFNLFEYKEAAESGDYLIQNFSSILDSISLAGIKNSYEMDIALKDVPKQSIIRNKDFNIPLEKDIASLLNIKVSTIDTTTNFIFDTGANISVIRRTYVDKMGLQLIESNFKVGTITGKKVNSDLAVAPIIDIGGITYKNVVFLVFDDKDMSVPGYDYYGVIGYPVIKAMKEIQIDSNNNLFVPKELTNYNDVNLALDGLTPLILGKHKNESLVFTLDTGADYTILYPKYYRKYKTEIEADYQKKTFSYGGAGGNMTYDGYQINDFDLEVAGSEKRIDSLDLHIKKHKATASKYYGNLGHDFIDQFNKMIISFEYASIVFE